MKRNSHILVGSTIAVGVLALGLVWLLASSRLDVDAEVLEVLDAARQIQENLDVIDDSVRPFDGIASKVSRFDERQAKDMLLLASRLPSRFDERFAKVSQRFGFEKPGRELSDRTWLSWYACRLVEHLPESIDLLTLLGEIKKDTHPSNLSLAPYICIQQAGSNVVPTLLGRFDEPQYYERVCIALRLMKADEPEAVRFVLRLTNHADVKVREAAVAAAEQMR